MIINRVIDNAAVAAASLTRAPVSAARQQALDHAVSIGGDGATVFGCALDRRTSPEWAAWANGVAVRELDYHDTFLAAEYSHPGDNIPPILAVAQHVGADGRRSCAASPPATRSRSTWCARSACTSTRSTTSPTSARRPPPASARSSASTPRRSTRPSARRCTPPPPRGSRARARSRRGRRTPRPSPARWRSRRSTARCAARPRRARSTRARTASSRGCWTARMPRTRCRCPAAGEAKRGILDSYTKEHSAEYQAQAWIDLARRLGDENPELARPGEHRVDRAAHEPPHALRHRLGRERPAEVRPDGVARDARPLDPVHLRGRAAGRRLAPRRLVRARARGPRRHRRAVAQDHDRRGRGVDAPLPLRRPEREGLRRPRRDPPDRRRAIDRRDRRRRRAPARRPAVRPRGLHPQVPDPRRAGAVGRRDRAVPRPRPAPARADARRGAGSSRSSPSSACSPAPRRPKGLF